MKPPRYLNNISLGQLAIVVAVLGTFAGGATFAIRGIWAIGETVQSIQDQLATDAGQRAELARMVAREATRLGAREHSDVDAINRRLDALTAAVLGRAPGMAPD